MVYIFIFCLIWSFLQSIDREKTVNYSQLIFIFPFFLVCYISIPGFQYQLGTDYNAYKDMYFIDPMQLQRIYNKGEYLFYYIYKLIIDFRLGDQAIFIVTSVINAFSIYITLVKLKKYNFKMTIIFFVFFFCTGIYHNQMNGLRQMMVVCIVPLLCIFFWEKKYIKSAILCCVMVLLHNTSFIIFFVIFFAKLISNRIGLLKLSLLSIIVYIFIIPKLMDVIIAFIFPAYLYYLKDGFLPSLPIIVVLSKLYYAPLILLASYLIMKRNENRNSLVYFLMIICNLTFFSFLSAYYYGFFIRYYLYFGFLIVIPICYLFQEYSNYKERILLFIYIAVPYVLKVCFFPSHEYLFRSVLINAF